MAIISFDAGSSNISLRDSEGVSARVVKKKSPNSLIEQVNGSNIPAGCTLMIMSEGGSEISHITNKFFLSNMAVSFKERVQLTETFGASSVAFFDDTVKVYQFSGQAIDWPSAGGDMSTMQGTSLLTLYNDFLRGTILIKNKQIAVMRVFNHLIYGYPLNFNMRYSSNADKIVNFNTSWVISKHAMTALPGVISKEVFYRNFDANKIEGPLEKQISDLREILSEYESLSLGEKETAINEAFSYLKDSGLTSFYRSQLEDEVNLISVPEMERDPIISEIRNKLEEAINSMSDHNAKNVVIY